MSTPSTATATLPPHQSQYPYHHHSYQSTNGSYSASNGAPPRLTASYNTFPGADPTSTLSRSHQSPQSSKQPSYPAPMTSSQSTSAMSNTHRSTKRKPDWGEFFKNWRTQRSHRDSTTILPPPHLKLPERTINAATRVQAWLRIKGSQPIQPRRGELGLILPTTWATMTVHHIPSRNSTLQIHRAHPPPLIGLAQFRPLHPPHSATLAVAAHTRRMQPWGKRENV